jgi:hypothetical protein
MSTGQAEIPAFEDHVVTADVLLLDAEWPSRALVRAQLLDEGFEALGTDTWPMARRVLLSGVRPRLVIVNLHGLPDAQNVLNELSALVESSHVLLIAGAGSTELAGRFPGHVLRRPIPIASIVATAARLIAEQTD